MRNYCPTCSAVVTHGDAKCWVCGTVLNWSRTGGKMVTRQFSSEDIAVPSPTYTKRKSSSIMRFILQIIFAVFVILGIVLALALIAGTLIFLRLLLMS